MTPRTDISPPLTATVREARDARMIPDTRLPVYREQIDNIEGLSMCAIYCNFPDFRELNHGRCCPRLLRARNKAPRGAFEKCRRMSTRRVIERWRVGGW